MIKLHSTDGSVLMEIQALEQAGNELHIKGKVFGTMPMTARLTAEETRQGFRLLTVKLGGFLITLPFRRSKHA
jgi:hypothetical protein